MPLLKFTDRIRRRCQFVIKYATELITNNCDIQTQKNSNLFCLIILHINVIQKVKKQTLGSFLLTQILLRQLQY